MREWEFLQQGGTGEREFLRLGMALGNQHSVTEWLEVAPGSFTAEFLPSSSWPFSILDVVQPVALQVRRPLVAVVSGGHRNRVWGGLCAGLWVLLFLLLLL